MEESSAAPMTLQTCDTLSRSSTPLREKDALQARIVLLPLLHRKLKLSASFGTSGPIKVDDLEPL